MRFFLLFLVTLTFLNCDRLIRTSQNDRCICTEEYNPVCVEARGNQIQYDNPCKARCAGFNESNFVSCTP